MHDMSNHQGLDFIGRIRQEVQHWLRSDWSFKDVARHWDATEDYDEINRETYSYFRRFTDGLKFGRLDAGLHILDFCARTGNGTRYFYENGIVQSAVCADVSLKMGEICIQHLKGIGLRDFTWKLVENYDLPFEDHSFDAILCFETVEHFSEPERLIAELGRVIRPGGSMILTTPNVLWEPIHALAAIFKLHHSEGPHRFIRFNQLKAMVKHAGFEIECAVTTVLVPGGPKVLVRLGEWLETRTQSWLLPILGLRRIIVARKQDLSRMRQTC